MFHVQEYLTEYKTEQSAGKLTELFYISSNRSYPLFTLQYLERMYLWTPRTGQGIEISH